MDVFHDVVNSCSMFQVDFMGSILHGAGGRHYYVGGGFGLSLRWTSDLTTLWISSKFCTSKRFLDDWFQVDMAYQACGVECMVASETGDFVSPCRVSRSWPVRRHDGGH